jgi:hypothetical protein
LEEKIAVLVQKTENTALGILCACPRKTFYPQKLTLTSPTSGGSPIDIVRSRLKATEFLFDSAAADPVNRNYPVNVFGSRSETRR